MWAVYRTFVSKFVLMIDLTTMISTISFSNTILGKTISDPVTFVSASDPATVGSASDPATVGCIISEMLIGIVHTKLQSPSPFFVGVGCWMTRGSGASLPCELSLCCGWIPVV